MLHRDDSSGRFLLVNVATEEKLWLPEREGHEYLLEFDAEGAGKLSCGAARTWTCGLPWSRLVKVGHSVYVLSGDETAVSLQSWKTSHEVQSFSLPREHARAEPVEIYRFRHSWGWCLLLLGLGIVVHVHGRDHIRDCFALVPQSLASMAPVSFATWT